MPGLHTAIRIGVIGAGRLGTFHARKIRRLPNVLLVGVADPVEARRLALAAECDCPTWEDYRPLLEACDAVVVATPASTHATIVEECLLKGRHVFVEKPLAVSMAEAEPLVNLARKTGLILQVGHIERFNPAFQAALPYIHDPWRVETVRQGPFSFRSTDIGCVFDLMIHDLDLVRAIVRAPTSAVRATGIALLGPYEDIAQAELHFANGASAVLKTSRIERQPARWMRVWTRDAIIDIDFAARKTTVCHLGEKLRQGMLDITRLSGAELEELKHTFESQWFDYQELIVSDRDPLEDELHDFVESVRTGRPPLVSGESGLEAVGLAEAVIQSLDLRRLGEPSGAPTIREWRRAA
ncbi:Gfo/Idh/MocA family protein [Thermogutta sp.]|uniref:Gfo/Idh/MocA family protein n=1 Tax=Thermogutta sp. TaxID=1962930 RepID=UPI003C7E14AE